MSVIIRILTWTAVCAVTGVILNYAGPFAGWAWGEGGGAETAHRHSAHAEKGDGAGSESGIDPNGPRHGQPAREHPRTDRESGSGTETKDHDGAGVDDDVRTGAEGSGGQDRGNGGGPGHGDGEPAGAGQSSRPGDVVDKTEMQRMYEKLCDIHLERLSRPETGRRYRIRCESGRLLQAKLLDVGEGFIAVRTDHGRLRVPLHHLAGEEIATFFPERAAEMRALRDLKRTARRVEEERGDSAPRITGTDVFDGSERHGDSEAGAGASTRPEAGKGGDEGRGPQNQTAGAGAQPDGGGQGGGAGPEKGGKKVSFDPAPAETPQSLRAVLQSFVHWLEVQQRHVGGSIGEEAYCKKHAGGRVAVYLVTSPLFRKQDYELRFRIAEGMWKFWGFRCQARGVVSHPREAYLVLLDDDHRIIGGSEPGQSNNIWVVSAQGPDE